MLRPNLLAVGLLLAAILCNVLAAIEPDPVQEEMAKLQGTWQVIKWIDSSEEAASADEIKDASFKFKKDHLTIRKDKDDKGRELAYTLDPTKDPKWIDVDMRSLISEGIYKLDGDKLTICLISGTRNDKAAPRPKEFKARKREKYTVFVLKKVKK
jgi:uncharacterized protein (TIGR03067 family)